MPIPSRESYEGGNGGWADGRLGQAYDLIDAVLKRLGEDIEAADIELGRFK